jgi:hypothetical protein
MSFKSYIISPSGKLTFYEMFSDWIAGRTKTISRICLEINSGILYIINTIHYPNQLPIVLKNIVL